MYVDEIHSLVSSRSGSKKINKAMNLWISQVRKILQGNENNNIYYTTQRPMSVDVGWRDLTHYWVVCEKKALPVNMKTKVYTGKYLSLPVVVSSGKWFDNLKSAMEYMQLGIGKPIRKETFVCNDYYRYYDTCELISFGDKYL